MSEEAAIDTTSEPLTAEKLRDAFARAGLTQSSTVLVHCSMSRLGWVVGGVQTVLQALFDTVHDGTLMMPTFTSGNSDPRDWQDPPVPEAWWPLIRANLPAYDPSMSPERRMGALSELFRAQPNTLRSEHPMSSFAARGRHAAFLLADHALGEGLGERSPLGRLYELGGTVLLLGVTHRNDSSLHLAEHRARVAKRLLQTGCAMNVEGQRRWVEFETLALDESDFEILGCDFDEAHPAFVHPLGNAHLRCFPQRLVVDFAVAWMERRRSP